MIVFYLCLQAYSINRLIAVPSLMRVILPTFQSPYNTRVQSSLKTLVLSGEVFPISLWEMLHKLLPKTVILNLYGSTEVRNLHSHLYLCKQSWPKKQDHSYEGPCVQDFFIVILILLEHGAFWYLRDTHVQRCVTQETHLQVWNKYLGSIGKQK